ncbi:Stk1 family PASTA domain-containing Ser/Thr kinase [Agromyces archimandritae]
MIGRLIDGRYQVRSRIARGGMATVYLATDLRLERRVAIKIMHGHLADDNTFKTRFVQEARSAARLAHPNVVNVYDQGQDADSAYLVMEYLPGITLRELLKDYQKLTPEQTTDIMDAVLAGLAAAHQSGIVHRDVKPENVLLADDGRIKLGDFGLARAASANTATGQALLGTIAYLSPELVTRGVADARSDLYAVGIMMYEMLTGEQPFVGEAPMQIAYQHANEQVPPPSAKDPSLPIEFDELVLWATARDPEDRPADARQLLERLREIEGSVRGGEPAGSTRVLERLPEGAAAPTASIAETAVLGTRSAAPAAEPEDDAARLTRTAERRTRRGTWIFALVVLLIALAGGTGWYFGAGPGAFAEVPKVTGLPANAEQQLVDAGFVVQNGERHDPKVPEGQVSGTDPAAGEQARRGGTVQLFVSLGARILPVPDAVGMTEEQARDTLSDFAVAEKPDRRFTDDVEAGNVIAVLDENGEPLGAEYPELGAITLAVSAGPIPDTWNESADSAAAILDEAGLKSAVVDEVFDNSGKVAAGAVLEWWPENDGVVRPGDTIDLRLSKGQNLVPLPDVVGKKMQDAVAELREAGFNPVYQFPDALLGIANVKSMDPAGGGDQTAVEGSDVTLVGTLDL